MRSGVVLTSVCKKCVASDSSMVMNGWWCHSDAGTGATSKVKVSRKKRDIHHLQCLVIASYVCMTGNECQIMHAYDYACMDMAQLYYDV